MSAPNYSQFGFSEKISLEGQVTFRIGCLTCRELLPWKWAAWQADLGGLNRVADEHWQERHVSSEQEAAR